MNKKRVSEILVQEKLDEVFYNERPVWIQELNDNVAKVGFIDTNEEKDISIEDLYEKKLPY